MSDSKPAGSKQQAAVQIAGWLLAALLAIVAVYFHVVLLQSAGPLWRDEINTLVIAQLPWNELWPTLDYDSFPLAGPLLVRGWSALGLAESHTALRAFGLLVGVGILATLWLHGCVVGSGPPLVSTALFGLSVVTIRYGDSIRSYGVGLLFILLTYVALVAVLKQRTPLRTACAAVAAVLSVQCLFQNALPLLAMGLAGAGVAVSRKERTTAVTILAIGAVAALSLLPYLGPLRRSSEWSTLMTQEVTLVDVKNHLLYTLSAPNESVGTVWGVVALLAVAATAISLLRSLQTHRPTQSRGQTRRADKAQRKQRRAASGSVAGGDATLDKVAQMPSYLLAFATLTVLLAWGLTVGLLVSGGFDPKPWYFLSVLGLTALWIDTALAALFAGGAISLGVRSVVAAGVGLIATSGATPHLRQQHTNAPAVAALVSEQTTADDLVVVLPWHFGVSWEHYYAGEAAWTTAPPIADSKIHRYDLLREQIEAGASLEEVFGRMERTLKAGNSVWIVGFIWPSNRRPPPALLAERDDTWDVNRQLFRWAIDVTRFVERHAQRSAQPLEHPPGFTPSPYEFLDLWRIEGWQDEPPQTAS